MKRTIITVAIMGILALVGPVQSAQANTFFDNFNDGNADGWISVAGYPPGTFGNWRVENGVVIQDQGHDGFMFLVNNFPMSNQSVETKILWNDAAYGGITLWNYDVNTFVVVSISPRTYSGLSLTVDEYINGVRYNHNYPLEVLERTWYTLKVDANSLTGELAIYLNDTYLRTQALETTYRTGLTGFLSGNGGGSFDDFRLTSTNPVPLPLTVWLLGSGLLGLAGWRRFKKG